MTDIVYWVAVAPMALYLLANWRPLLLLLLGWTLVGGVMYAFTWGIRGLLGP